MVFPTDFFFGDLEPIYIILEGVELLAFAGVTWGCRFGLLNLFSITHDFVSDSILIGVVVGGYKFGSGEDTIEIAVFAGTTSSSDVCCSLGLSSPASEGERITTSLIGEIVSIWAYVAGVIVGIDA